MEDRVQMEELIRQDSLQIAWSLRRALRKPGYLRSARVNVYYSEPK
jgi:hypothetical protein